MANKSVECVKSAMGDGFVEYQRRLGCMAVFFGARGGNCQRRRWKRRAGGANQRLDMTVRLEDQCRDVMRRGHLSPRTKESQSGWPGAMCSGTANATLAVGRAGLPESEP